MPSRIGAPSTRCLSAPRPSPVGCLNAGQCTTASSSAFGVASGREPRPVAGHRAEEVPIGIAEHIVRRGAEVVAEEQVDLEAVNHAVCRHRVDLVSNEYSNTGVPVRSTNRATRRVSHTYSASPTIARQRFLAPRASSGVAAGGAVHRPDSPQHQRRIPWRAPRRTVPRSGRAGNCDRRTPSLRRGWSRSSAARGQTRRSRTARAADREAPRRRRPAPTGRAVPRESDPIRSGGRSAPGRASAIACTRTPVRDRRSRGPRRIVRPALRPPRAFASGMVGSPLWMMAR